MEIRGVTTVQRQLELAVVVNDGEVRDDIVVVLACRAHRAAWFGVERQDDVERVFEFLFRHAAARHDFVVMFLGEFLKILVDNGDGVGVVFVGVLAFEASQLDEETFLEVCRANAGRVEVLDYLKHFANLVFCGVDVLSENKVVGNAGNGS